MALRIVIADNTFCSGCGNAVEARAGLCFTCGQPFEGETTGTKCPQCGRAVEQAQSQCPACGTEFPRAAEPEVHAQASAPEPPPPPEDKNLLAEIKSFRDQGRADLDRLADIPTAPPTEATDQSLLAELESMWKLAKPFEEVVLARRKRLEQMDRLVAAARRRVRELEESGAPSEVREREELKRQVQEVLLERDEILKIEFGIAEMERIYRNIITTQQKELRAKEDALKARLEGFRKEIGIRDAERQALVDRERELEQREKDLQARLASAELDRAAAPSKPPPNPSPPRSNEQDGDGAGVTREQWLAAQREIQDALMQLRGTHGEIILPTAEGIRDLRMRVNELEESLEQLSEAKAKLEQELSGLQTAEGQVRDVLREVDELLGKLPDEEIKRFARSDAFKRYEQLLERLGL